MRQGASQRSVAVDEIGRNNAAIDQGASLEFRSVDCREAQEFEIEVAVKRFERQKPVRAAVKIDDANIQRLALLKVQNPDSCSSVGDILLALDIQTGGPNGVNVLVA